MAFGASREETLQAADDFQDGRRNSNTAKRVLRMTARLKDGLDAQANCQAGRGDQKSGCQIKDNAISTVNTMTEIAKASGTSRDTVHKVTTVMERATPEVRMSIKAAAKLCRQSATTHRR